MGKSKPFFIAAVTVATCAFAQSGEPSPGATTPPKTWIDAETGHRAVRLTDEPGSASLYFNDNGYTASGKEMIYTTPKGISVLDLQTFKSRPVVDPALLMYCHEGPWQKVDRIWTIRTDGTGNTLVHKRTMTMEIAGHEFWGQDGKTIWYDLQTPKGEDFWVAGYNLDTHQRTWYHLQRNEWSIHFNVSRDGALFCGDGGDPGQVAHAPDGEWLYLFPPQLIKNTGVESPDLIRPGVFHAERLLNMSRHHYKLEPNVSFTPDQKWVVFRSNMFGPSYVFAVEVAKPGGGE